MGDHFQIIVDQHVEATAAVTHADRVLRWLIDEGIVESRQSDCVLGKDGGYRPGPSFAKVTDRPDDRFLTLRTNGLAVITGRTVFDAGQGGLDLVCAVCAHRFEATSGAWANAVSEWYDQSGPGLLQCPRCGECRPVVEWQHDPVYGYGNLGFEFWNWPTLRPDFIQAVGEWLSHPVVLVRGKL